MKRNGLTIIHGKHKVTSQVLVIGGLSSSLVNFRGPLLKAIVAKGHTVFAAANGRDQDTEAKLHAMGVTYCPIRIARAGMNPLGDLVALFDLLHLMQRLRPDVVLSYTIKPVIYGGLAARICGVSKIFSLITGLGYAFMDATSLRQRLAGWLANSLYRWSLRFSDRVFFQNPDDSETFIKLGLISRAQAVVVNGSGIDLEYYCNVPKRENMSSHGSVEQQDSLNSGPVRFLLIARLLRDKGICEYAAAARSIKKKYPLVEFDLVGPYDPNPAGLKPEDVTAWETEGIIRFHGNQDDIRPFIRDCHVYVLPSYREGTPRTVLEAMAMGRPIITTDAPGCRETVLLTAQGKRQKECGASVMDGENGFLVKVHDADALAHAIEQLIKQPQLIPAMGRRSRELAEEKYDVHKVNDIILSEMGL